MNVSILKMSGVWDKLYKLLENWIILINEWYI